MLENSPSIWHPIASSDDLVPRHVYQGQLLGRELAVWRADDGYVNVWENRCLHRGVRLSIGINDGRELKCQYHGWRYANRSAGCTYIPAHPADAPARTITNRTFPVVERYGLIWSREEPAEDEMPEFDALDRDGGLVLRPIPVDAPPGLVLDHIRDHRFSPSDCLDEDAEEIHAETQGSHAVILRARARSVETGAVFFVQPVDANRCVIRGVLDRAPELAEHRTRVLRHHNGRLSRLRERVEAMAKAMPAPAPLQPAILPLPAELAELPASNPSGRKAALRVRVASKWQAGAGIAGFELRALSGVLPTFQPGAHIDVHLPNGLIRQYSLVNAPGEGGAYFIGVKLEPDSAGGSVCLHEQVGEGDLLAISEPRNNFPLRRDAVRSILIAGGIGITPLLAMAQALHYSTLNYELHCFVRDEASLAFPDRLGELQPNVNVHSGLDAGATSACLSELLSGVGPKEHFYLCGPGPMMDAALSLAGELGLPDEVMHFEFFKNTREIDDSSSFEVALARSALTVQIPAGRSILEVLRKHGVDMPSSCEQGACGTCLASVIEGIPDHQDVYLNAAEKESGTKIMTCVSRALSKRLVLDI